MCLSCSFSQVTVVRNACYKKRQTSTAHDTPHSKVGVFPIFVVLVETRQQLLLDWNDRQACQDKLCFLLRGGLGGVLSVEFHAFLEGLMRDDGLKMEQLKTVKKHVERCSL